MIKKVKLNKEIITLEYIDNKKKDTLVCIHGIFSDKDFIGDLKTKLKHYNILTLSYGEAKRANVENYIKIIDEAIKKFAKRQRVHILAHSMGGYIGARVAQKRRVKSATFVNPMHPFLEKGLVYKSLLSVVKPDNKSTKTMKLPALINKMVQSRDGKMTSYLKNFTDPKNKWYPLVTDVVTNQKLVKTELDKLYRNIKVKSEFMISEPEYIISSKAIREYLDKINAKYTLLDVMWHAPLLHNSHRIRKHLEAKVENKKKKRLKISR